ncbi:type II secretion system F family protein [Cryptosporangium arvum]|uniref:type II secretion system F family protein n=1 Tax=Cryptosporangium arvum TaxID=80871 RepID=UPI0004B90801|nr:type II secretion system F family protein [Cryptosporangium arvum]
MKRWLATTAVIALLGAATPAVAAPSPQPLEPIRVGGPALQVSGFRTLPGEVEFVLHPDGFATTPDLSDPVVTAKDEGGLAATTGELPESSADPNRAVVVVLRAGADVDTLRAAIARYAVNAPDGVAIGLVAIGERPVNLIAPTTDRNDFLAALARSAGATSGDLPGAVAQADAMLVGAPGAEQYRDRRILVVTSGDAPEVATAGTIGARMAAGGRPLDAVTVGTPPESVTTLVAATGGSIRTSGSASGVRGALDRASAELAAAVLVRAAVPYTLSGRTAELSVTGGNLTTKATPVKFAVDPDAIGAAPVPASATGGSIWSLLVGLTAVSALLVWFAVRVLAPALAGNEGRRAMARLQRILEHPRGGKRRSRFSVVTLSGQAADAVSKVLTNPARRAKIELSLERAGSSMTPDQWVALRIAICVGLVVVLALMFGLLPGLLLGLVGGVLGTRTWLRFRAARRARAFAEQLPDSLRIVVGSLRSGFSLHQAIDSVATEGDGPVAAEFRRALAEIRLGGDLEEALERVAERNNSRDITWLVMALRIQSDVGGSLAEVVETTVETMRERGRLERHVRALSAEGRLSGNLLLALPIGVGGFLFLIRREYVRPLYTTTVGIIILASAALLMVVGAAWIRKLVKVEV